MTQLPLFRAAPASCACDGHTDPARPHRAPCGRLCTGNASARCGLDSEPHEPCTGCGYLAPWALPHEKTERCVAACAEWAHFYETEAKAA